MALNHQGEIVLKLLIIGDSGAGKSSLLTRFVDDTFDSDSGPTIGVDFKAKTLDINGKRVKLTVWDTAGQERFRTLTASYYRGAHGVVLVYDVTRPETFEHVTMWLNELDVYATNPKIVKMLVGNKVDLPNREVTQDQGLNFAKSRSMLFIECSAKTKKGVDQAFEELAQKVVEHEITQTGRGVSLHAGAQPESTCGAC